MQSISQKMNVNLSSFVQEKCEHLSLQFIPEAEEAAISEKEKVLIQHTSFPEELGFTVKVDLGYSKRAFLNIVSGLNEDLPCFEDLWKLKPHDPHGDYYPMGPLDIGFFTDATFKTVQVSGEQEGKKTED